MDQRLRPQDTGTTLVELLVVVAILAVLGVGVSLMAVRAPQAAPQQDQTRFRTTFTRLQDLSVQGQAVHGLQVSASGWQAMRRDGDGWQPLGQPQRWQGRALLSGGTRAYAPGGPQIVLLPSGQSTPFDIRFAAGADRARACRGTGWDGVTCD